MVLTANIRHSILAWAVALGVCASACKPGPTADPCKPTASEQAFGHQNKDRVAECAEVRRAAAANRQPVEETPTLTEVVEQCRAGKDEICATYLSDARYWNAALGMANADWTIFESACRGGHANACSLVEQAQTQDDPIAGKRYVAAMFELQELEKQWTKQLATLSQMKCATGEQDVIPQEWEKGAKARAERLTALDTVVDEVKVDAPRVAGSWPALRENFELRIKAAEKLAFSCQLGT